MLCERKLLFSRYAYNGVMENSMVMEIVAYLSKLLEFC